MTLTLYKIDVQFLIVQFSKFPASLPPAFHTLSSLPVTSNTPWCCGQVTCCDMQQKPRFTTLNQSLLVFARDQLRLPSFKLEPHSNLQICIPYISQCRKIFLPREATSLYSTRSVILYLNAPFPDLIAPSERSSTCSTGAQSTSSIIE